MQKLQGNSTYNDANFFFLFRTNHYFNSRFVFWDKLLTQLVVYVLFFHKNIYPIILQTTTWNYGFFFGYIFSKMDFKKKSLHTKHIPMAWHVSNVWLFCFSLVSNLVLWVKSYTTTSEHSLWTRPTWLIFQVLFYMIETCRYSLYILRLWC